MGVSAKLGTGIVIARLGGTLDHMLAGNVVLGGEESEFAPLNEGDGLLSKDGWSAPCAIGSAGVGFGFQIGAELTDVMLVLNTDSAVEAFSSGRQLTLGGTVGIAVGPVGRQISGSGHMNKSAVKQKMNAAPCYSYSHSKGELHVHVVWGSTPPATTPPPPPPPPPHPFKGLFAGISLEGAVIQPRTDVNAKVSYSTYPLITLP